MPFNIQSIEQMKKVLFFLAYLLILYLFQSFTTNNIDFQLKKIIRTNNIKPEIRPAEINPQKVELGRLLFFDKILSGNKDISCATCHHPSLSSTDELSLSIGVGGKGLGRNRKIGANRVHIPRNSPDLFNRGVKEWHTMFWDSRVSGSVESGFDTPADDKLPEGLENILAVQAMFPVTSRDEMRGEIGDEDVHGEVNELALISDASLEAIWHRIMLRVLKIPQYQDLFQEVYPDIELKDLGFQHAANAIAAFEMEAFTLNDSPWDQYIAGDSEALSLSAKQGAILFYNKANCGICHRGTLFTDQKSHNIGVPQFGPGKTHSKPLDLGRFLESGLPDDLFAFRTPSLKNTAITGPWMHNGAYHNLEDAIRHHLNPQEWLKQYDGTQLEEALENAYQHSEVVHQRILNNLDPKLSNNLSLNDQEVEVLVRFLDALTDTSALQLEALIPRAVPSGLPVTDE